MEKRQLKPLVWVGSSKRDFAAFPDPVQDEFGYALFLAQVGRKYEGAKPLKGFSGAGVLEIMGDFDGDTYRTVYTVRFDSAVYVLHAFQKKSKRGIETPRHEMELVTERLQWARRMHQEITRNQEQR
ncbi:MAG TPA: type II toxin-antitoxin system RelE/ParE family toxin [Longimicrobium sp.]|jgi:phage-related protein